MLKSAFTTTMMMEMRMWICQMCMVCYAYFPDVVSISKAKRAAA